MSRIEVALLDQIEDLGGIAKRGIGEDECLRIFSGMKIGIKEGVDEGVDRAAPDDAFLDNETGFLRDLRS